MTLRSHLHRVVFLAILPGLLFAAVMVFIYHRQQVTRQQATLIDSAERVSRDIDRELTASIRTLQVLAASDHLTGGDVKSFHRQAIQALAAHGVWQGIALVAPNLEMVANTRVPFGSVLPRAGQANLLPEVVKTGKPAISNLFTGPVTKAPLIAVAIPVNRNGRLRWLLVANTAPDFLRKLFAEQRLTAGWSGTIMDRDKNVILRTNGQSDHQGEPASAKLAQSSRASARGLFQETPQGGPPLAFGFYRSELSGWTVGIAQPLADFNQPLHRSLGLIATVGLVFLAVGLWLATSLARRIASGIAGLANNAQANDSSKPATRDNGATTVEEIRAIADTLSSIAAERVEAEKALRGSEARFRAIFEQAALGVAEVDSTTGRLLRVNRRFCRILGYSEEQALDLDAMRLALPEDFATDLAAVEQLKSAGKREFTMEKHLVDNNGRAVWVALSVSAMWPEGSPPTSYIAIIEDISERKTAEEKVISTEKRYRAMIEQSADGIALLAVDGALAYLNPSASRITGRNPAERVGTDTGAFFHPEDKSIIPDAIAALLRDPRSIQRVELRTRRQDGSWRWLEASLTNCLDDPNVQAIITNYRDITERKTAEEKLHQVNEEIQQLYEVARSLHGSTDLKDMGEAILNQALHLSACDLGAIRLREDANAPIWVVARRGYRDPQNLQRHTKSSARPNSDGESRPRDRMRTFEFRQTSIVEQIEANERMATFYREGICSLITIPVAIGDSPHCVLQLGSRTPRRFEPRLVRLLETLAHDFGIAAQKARLLQQALANQEQLRDLSHRLVDAQESERRFIARELHDEIGSLLSALKIMIKLDGGDTAQSLAVVDEALAKTRAIAQHLRPPMLDDLGLAPTLAWYAKEFSTRTKIAVEVKLDGIDRRYGADIEIAVFRTFQEALTNVARHAHANSVVALFSANADRLRVAILDNGVGFDTKNTLERPSSSGLSGMRERVAALGGRIEISRDESGGTAVDVEIPLQQDRDDRTLRRGENLQ